MSTARIALVLVVAVTLVPAAAAYPVDVDGCARTGIRRLTGTANAQTSKVHPKLAPGALLGTNEIRLPLVGTPGAKWDYGAEDPVLQAAIESIFGPRDPSYGVAVIDITDPNAIAWAGHREGLHQYPGSVGKVLCMTALFDGLRRAFPAPADRERILRDTIVIADAWSVGDSHKVPVFNPETGFSKSRPIVAGDSFTLAEWVDHMVSASANSAGSTVWKEAMLLRHFGSEYPVSRERAEELLARTPKNELFALSQVIITEPLVAAGLDTAHLVQGTFWTNGGQARVPGRASFASPRELARFLLRIEQGRLVDEWSSLEMKRYLYLTRKRYRYGYAPELRDAALYFKSGSLYDCEPEPDFKCGKYKGNVKNFMNSIVIVESPARPQDGVPTKRYIVALVSNVLRVNSAWDHARVGAAIEEAVRTRSETVVREAGTAQAITEAGKSE